MPRARAASRTSTLDGNSPAPVRARAWRCLACALSGEARALPGFCPGCGCDACSFVELVAANAAHDEPRLPTLDEARGRRVRLRRTGIREVDRLLGGFAEGTCSLLYGGEGSGKSSLSLRIASALGPSLIVCPEMSEDILRHTARRAGADLSRLVRCPDPEQFERDARDVGARLVLYDSVSKAPRPKATLDRLIAWCQRAGGGVSIALAHRNAAGKPLGPVALRHDPDAVLCLHFDRRMKTRTLECEKARWAAAGSVQLASH